jgi:hypothetical protein
LGRRKSESKREVFSFFREELTMHALFVIIRANASGLKFPFAECGAFSYDAIQEQNHANQR